MIANLLVGVGPPRTGTTWLHTHLKRHPNIRLALGILKEVHYFDRFHPNLYSVDNGTPDIAPRRSNPEREKRLVMRLSNLRSVLNKCRTDVRRAALSAEISHLENFIGGPICDDWYEKAFSASTGQWALDISPNYCVLSDDAIAHMKASAKNTRCLISLRHPYDRLMSQLSNLHRQKRINLTSLSYEQEIALLEHPYIQATCDYAQILQRIGRIFDRPMIKIIIFEEMMESSTQKLNNIFDFCGLSPAVECFEDLDRSPNPAGRPVISVALRDSIAELASRSLMAAKDCMPIPPAWTLPRS